MRRKNQLKSGYVDTIVLGLLTREQIPRGEYTIWGEYEGRGINRVTSSSGSSNSYGSWENARNALQSIEMQVIWETPEGKHPVLRRCSRHCGLIPACLGTVPAAW